MSEFNLPIDFTNRMKALLKEEWDEFLECYENHNYQALRINALKGNDNEILTSLGMSQIEAVPWADHGYYYDKELRPGKHPYHEMGLYYIQEPSAMSAAALLAVKPGETVLDLCSAPGGKATQLAVALKGQGLLVANEIHPIRCKILSQNIERMGIGNGLVTNEDPKDLAGHFPVFFDKILVDAPCSGEGMFRKNPEAMEEWSVEQVAVCANRQAEILNRAAIMLKPGGRMVYSTCTFAPEEDEMAIDAFLREHPDFEIEAVDGSYFSPANPQWVSSDTINPSLAHTFRLWPHKLHGEGHYVAVLKKKGISNGFDAAEEIFSEREVTKKSKNKKGQPQKKREEGFLNQEQKQSLEVFLQETLQEEIARELAGVNLHLFGEQLYALPKGITSLAGLKVLRPGLHLGTFKKNRFEPSHALALYLKKEDVKESVNLLLQDKNAIGFFRGESFFVEDAFEKKGYCLVCVDGFPAGWGKLSGGQVKNHYPKGLRKDLS